MKFKVLKSTELYNKLEEFMTKITYCRKEAEKIAKSLGAKGVCMNRFSVAGGIDALQFDKDKFPDEKLWKRVDPSNSSFCLYLFYPRQGNRYKQNKELLEKFEALPTVNTEEYNSVIGHDEAWMNSYGLNRGNDCFLIDFPNGVPYTPIDGMIEILESEYFRIYEEFKKSEEKN